MRSRKGRCSGSIQSDVWYHADVLGLPLDASSSAYMGVRPTHALASPIFFGGCVSRVCSFDLEISEPISAHKDGWAAAKRGECGVSCVVVWDSQTERPHLYDPYNIEECIKHLNAADLLVSFNGVEFDIPCLMGYTGMAIHAPHYDILQDIWTSLAGEKRGHGMWGLGKVSERALGMGKSGGGESAPKLFHEGRSAELMDYCLNDVHMTRRLANYIHDHGSVPRPDGTPLRLKGPGVSC